jgi:hypothetical protein
MTSFAQYVMDAEVSQTVKFHLLFSWNSYFSIVGIVNVEVGDKWTMTMERL